MNFLEHNFEERFDLVVMNPPFDNTLWLDFYNKSMELSDVIGMIGPESSLRTKFYRKYKALICYGRMMNIDEMNVFMKCNIVVIDLNNKTPFYDIMKYTDRLPDTRNGITAEQYDELFVPSGLADLTCSKPRRINEGFIKQNPNFSGVIMNIVDQTHVFTFITDSPEMRFKKNNKDWHKYMSGDIYLCTKEQAKGIIDVLNKAISIGIEPNIGTSNTDMRNFGSIKGLK